MRILKDILSKLKKEESGLNVLSLFDGISCGQVALERAGIKVNNYFASEIDKNAIKVTMANYPNTIQIGDVRNIDVKTLPKIDLLIGGSPCQDLSCCKNDGDGLKGKKSNLFFEYVRILKEVKPKYFLLENVASMREDDKDTISSIIGVQPVMIDSADFSAQYRKRYYWTNIKFETKNYKKCPLVLGDIAEEWVEEKYYYNYPLLKIDMTKQVCAIMDFKNNEMHKRVFNPAFKCSTLTTCGGGNTQKKILDKGRARKLTPLEYERLQTLPDNYTACVSNTHRYSACGNGWTVDVIAHILKGIKNK